MWRMTPGKKCCMQKILNKWFSPLFSKTRGHVLPVPWDTAAPVGSGPGSWSRQIADHFFHTAHLWPISGGGFLFWEQSHQGTHPPWFCSLCTIPLMYNTYVLNKSSSGSWEIISQVPLNFYESLFEINEVESRQKLIENGLQLSWKPPTDFFYFGVWPDVSSGIWLLLCHRWSAVACCDNVVKKQPQPSMPDHRGENNEPLV